MNLKDYTFRDFLFEAEMLDLSILSADKFLTSKSKIDEFLTSEVTVEEKLDGVKLTIIKKDNNGNINDYIIAYKGNILYSSEFNYNSDYKIKTDSIGNSQFKLIFDHISKLSKNSIPTGTELFVEFLMNKPTLSSNYNSKHKMVLIGYSKSTFQEEFGRLKTQNSGMKTDLRDTYAKELKIDTPPVLFKGIFGAINLFERGIINDKLKAEFNNRKKSMKWENQELLVQDIKSLFLFLESKYGGKPEGIVLSYKGRLLKFQQDYQTNQDARRLIKGQYIEDEKEKENQYWLNVQGTAQRIVNTIKLSRLEVMLEELSLIIKKLPLNFSHSKKNDTQIKDDIQGSCKILLIKKLKGNDNCLFLGKFRILTKAHYDIIKKGQKLFDKVVVALITSRDTADTYELRKEMLKKAFGNDIIIIENSSGNIGTLLKKAGININAILAGSDRVKEYQNQIGTQLGLYVKEIPRTGEDISATKIIENITNEAYFKKNTPREIHSLYSKILKKYLKNA